MKVDPLLVAFVGAPSTGKTTLARELAARFDTVWMNEYGRDYWMEHQSDRRLTPEQLVEIAEGHLERERRLIPQANRVLFVDTEAIVTWHYAIDYHGSAHPRLEQLAKEAESRYDLYFLCADDIAYDDTWERSGLQHRAAFQKQIEKDLIRRGIAFQILSGSLTDRINSVCQALEQLELAAPEASDEPVAKPPKA